MSLKEQLEQEFVACGYLGDGAYVGFLKGGAVVVFTSDGTSMRNRVELDPYALKSLNNFVNRMNNG